MPDDVFIAINSDALYAKSKVYMSRAMTRKAAADLEEYQLWASLALELLGKAALSRQHPCLVVDPQHSESLFVAAGINSTTDVKTISAKTLFERLTRLIPRFDGIQRTFCISMAERRNAELHSADLPFKTMHLDAWEERYWRSCDTILLHIEASLEDWIGAADARAPRRLLMEARAARSAAIKLRIEAHRKAFRDLKKAERERRHAESALVEPYRQASLFPDLHDKVWAETCPACGCRAFVAGGQTGEDIAEEVGEDGVWEIVNQEFVAEEFKCSACELSLIGSEELHSAEIDHTHFEKQEREMEYEPEYGND
ncbi:hypothetical protein [Phenylobacterium parvum]|uniref:Uncharacterized protein n=1 Tax=Phenylobacterium parvum TaxID=2201350 RepID=A0A2Z3HUK6_9CAUL|nr:hypothetical protein [Phenylobacterium parvum]AWM78535.1 hypothetical protein HYN04_12695 [Phenylobacterium parvum]